MTYDQQIQKLKDKHLLIPDDDVAKDILRHNGYFALISGYKDLFKNPSSRDYLDGTTLNDIVALYRFDEQLRELTLRHLLHIERHIRSTLSYSFCNTFGEQQSAYLDPLNYEQANGRNSKAIQRLINYFIAPLLLRQTDYPFIEHNKRVYGNVPLWVLVNALSFGSLSKMYDLSVSKVKSAVSKEFLGVNEKQLGQLLDVLTDYRNLCAHNERTFSHRCAKKDIPDLVLHQKLSIPKQGNSYLQGKRDYFAVVIAFRYLLPDGEFFQYKRHLSSLIDRAVKNNRKISEPQLLSIMGFPQNWKKVTSYRKV